MADDFEVLKSLFVLVLIVLGCWGVVEYGEHIIVQAFKKWRRAKFR